MFDESETYLAELNKLNQYKFESEEKVLKDVQNGRFYKSLVLTDRAVLAQRKIALKETLGRGCYSKVKEAYDLNHLRPIAVKIIDCSKAPKDFQEKFLPRELDVWPKVTHPNVITMYDYIINANKIYMILEFANGGDLLSYIQRINGPVPDKDCKLWMKQICNAVGYLHERNIIHRDLKLENLLIDSNRNIKLCDFGFSKDLNLLGNDDLSRTYCGSKAYASPEILLGQPYDPKKADIWAIGVIFFIFLTGNMPFKEDKCNQVILNQHKTLKLVWSKNAKVSTTAKNLIKTIFTFDWVKRPSIQDLVDSEWLSLSQETTCTYEYNLRSRFRNTNRRIDDNKTCY
ncbi:unnamed protein product [Brachionus calyciflorus]|uniref:Protein kinase domain-containing protein n=1 Tax=Brachionus calyciflorus TaxID=104777 RepID=A0A813YXI1_9BILA|nr:unnamed protein product [Brachionus calyciflorus]